MEGAQGGDGLGDQDGPNPHCQGPLFQVRIRTAQVGTAFLIYFISNPTLPCDRGVERIGDLQDATIIVRKENRL